MEERTTTGLYLELGDGDPGEFRRRAEALAKDPSVERVTWWENCRLGRRDIPMKIADRPLMALAEVAAGFAAPEAPAGTVAHCFRRHPRPSQGILTGRPTTGLLLVWISPREPELAQALRDWGDFVHIRHIAAAGIPGFTQISVYENVAPVDPMFMHFYEFDSEDPEATFSTMTDYVAPRLGGLDSEAYTAWADWRAGAGRLFYCNTFRLLGAVG